MPRLDKTKIKEAERGCRVFGEHVDAQGLPVGVDITVYPDHAGVYKRKLYSSTAIVVTPDVDGSFSVVLPPSTVMGKYTAVAGTDRYKFEVPDKDEIHIAELIENQS